MSVVTFNVPASDIIEEWQKKLEQIKQELIPAQARQAELKTQDLSDSCINGKVEYGEGMIAALELRLKYIDPGKTFTMDEHTLTQYFSKHSPGLGNIGGAGEVAQERRY